MVTLYVLLQRTSSGDYIIFKNEVNFVIILIQSCFRIYLEGIL